MIKSIMSSDEKKFQFLILPPGIPKNVFRIITYQHQKAPTSLFSFHSEKQKLSLCNSKKGRGQPHMA